MRIKVLNFFTISAYAPRSTAAGAASISYVRRKEDRRVLGAVGKSIRIADIDLLDAPLRLGIDPTEVCNPETRGLSTVEHLEAAARNIRLQSSDVALAPLALGNHIDHWLIHCAAIRSIKPGMLGFYEDLPYATWISETECRERVAAVEAVMRTSLQPITFRGHRAFRRKRRQIAQYQSQITPEEAETMARFSKTMFPGERIWVPRRYRRWSFVR